MQSTYYPLVDVELQEYLERIGGRVLDAWPVPLKGYRYRFQVVDSDEINASREPGGSRTCMTTIGLPEPACTVST